VSILKFFSHFRRLRYKQFSCSLPHHAAIPQQWWWRSQCKVHTADSGLVLLLEKKPSTIANLPRQQTLMTLYQKILCKLIIEVHSSYSDFEIWVPLLHIYMWSVVHFYMYPQFCMKKNSYCFRCVHDWFIDLDQAMEW